MRASKLRLPERTAAQTRSLLVIASLISGARSPELPMHVVQPYAARLNPSCSRYGINPVLVRYSVTTREPGASDVLICFLTLRPFSTAFFASSPAAMRTFGLEVLVQEVIAAINTSPEPISIPSRVLKRAVRSFACLANPLSAAGLENNSVKFALTLPTSIRSCGRLGPASDGVIVDRSSSTVLL